MGFLQSGNTVDETLTSIKEEIEAPTKAAEETGEATRKGLVTQPFTVVEEEEKKSTFDTVLEMFESFRSSWSDNNIDVTPVEDDPEQATLKFSSAEMAAKEKARGLPTAEQTSDKYALVMKRRGGPRKNKMPTLLKDQVFLDGINRLKRDHPKLPLDKFYQIIEGESAGNTDDRNANSGAVGLWQVTTDALTDLKERDLVPQDLTLDKIRYMDAGKQLDLYSKYLTRWGYDGKMSLGVLQAAPIKRKVENKEQVIFKKGSKAWNQNPGWRGPKAITLKSIDEYYFGDPVKVSLRPQLRP